MPTCETSYAPGTRLIAEHLQRRPPTPLARAVVLIASERHAHAIRRHVLVDRQRPQDLAGVLLTRPAELARNILARCERVALGGWEGIRRLRILTLFETEELKGKLAYFNATQLRSGQGYADAFAHTIDELEASGLDPATCALAAQQLAGEDGRNGERLSDVAVVWAAADAERGDRATMASVLGDAASVLTEKPELAGAFGPAFALLTSSPSTALLRFLRALDGCRIVFQEARPLRTDTQRWRKLIALPESDAPPPNENEIGLVQRYLFEVPEILTDPQRPRSRGPDGSVDLEEYSTIEDEVEAAAVWVTEQIDAGTPLEQIALIVPEKQTYAVTLRDRLARLIDPETQQALNVHVAGGVSLADTPAGRRFRSLLDALARSLEAESTIRLLPALRRGLTDAEHEGRLSPSRAAEIVYGAGITGGSPGDATGISEWTERLIRRRHALQQRAAEPEANDDVDDEPEKRTEIIDRHQANRWLRDVEPILPAIEALQRVAETVVAGASLSDLWNEIRDFASKWLRLPPDPPNLPALLHQRLQAVLQDPVAAAVVGRAAVRFLVDQLRFESTLSSRFGEPCVFVGTTAQACGLRFSAVRILGLAEGALPHTPHDDPIVPDVLRKRLEEIASSHRDDVVVPRLADRVLDELHDAYRVICGATTRLALSAPRQWTDRSDREVSGVMLEAATALGRQGQGTGGDVPTSARLRSAYFVPGRAGRSAAAMGNPLTPRSMMSSVLPDGDGAEAMTVPSSWLSRSSTDLDRIHSLSADAAALNAMDGLIPSAWEQFRKPGVGGKPLSASALSILLSCPHRFMLERLLYLSEPPRRPSSDAIDPIVYGSLFHTCVELFLREAGPALCRREGDLQEWRARARTIAAEQLEELLQVYPLRGADAVGRERDRLLRQIERLVEYEWHKPLREFVATELVFGDPDPVRVHFEDGDLFVRGAIDRIDRQPGGACVVRDIKTGRVYDLIDDPVNVGRDLQIGVYTLVLEAIEPGVRVEEATYVHPSSVHEQERAFAGGQLDQLRQHTRDWLRIAHAILDAGTFVRTPNADDCRFCPFVPSCGEGAQQRSKAKLSTLPESHELAGFVRMKKEGGEE